MQKSTKLESEELLHKRMLPSWTGVTQQEALLTLLHICDSYSLVTSYKIRIYIKKKKKHMINFLSILQQQVSDLNPFEKSQQKDPKKEFSFFPAELFVLFSMTPKIHLVTFFWGGGQTFGFEPLDLTTKMLNLYLPRLFTAVK